MNNTAQERTSQSLQRWEPSAWSQWIWRESVSAFGAPWNAPDLGFWNLSSHLHPTRSLSPYPRPSIRCFQNHGTEVLLWRNRADIVCFVLPQAAAWQAWRDLALLLSRAFALILATLLAWSIRPPTTPTPRPDTQGSSHLLFALAEIPLVHCASASSYVPIRTKPRQQGMLLAVASFISCWKVFEVCSWCTLSGHLAPAHHAYSICLGLLPDTIKKKILLSTHQ